MLPPGAAQRLDAHEKQREGKEGIETGAYLVDVNQWPDSGCSAAGPYWPCQSTRATAISFNHGRAAVGLEYLLAQGFHVFPEIHGGRPAQILPLVEGLKTDKIIALSGNSMSLPAFTAWMAYVFFDSMLYQAKKADKDKNGADKEMERAFCEAMKDDITAKNEVLAFCEMNPPDQRYARKQCIDWAAFKQKHGRRTEIIDRSKCTPMWEGEFLKWAENVKALPEAEAKAWWKEPLNNPRIERDNDGYKGRLQLWVPKSVARLTDKSKFTESAAEQGSKPIKDPKAEDVNMLKHIGPKLMKNMERDLKALVKQFHAASEKKEVAMSKLEKLNPSFLTDDLALLWLLRSLDLRVHFLDRCINDDQETTGKSFDFALEVAAGAKEALENGKQDFNKGKSLTATQLIAEFQTRLPFKEGDSFLDESKCAAGSEDYQTIREEAKKAADELKDKKKTTAKVEPVFDISQEETEKLVDEVPEVKGPSLINSWAHPWVIKDWDSIKNCLTDQAFKKSLDTFASQYKKLGGSTGRHQYAIQSGEVKKIVETMLQEVMPATPSPYLAKLTADKLEECHKKKVSMWRHKLAPNNALFVPVGFVTVEKVASGSSEVCGMRKSFFPTSEGAIVSSYETVVEQCRIDKRSITVMSEVASGLARAVMRQELETARKPEETSGSSGGIGLAFGMLSPSDLQSHS
ncbi:Uncharacterized protein SCF082_LOCUS39189 [Durusdinium trenchii]|uniref:Uncharacterized protein n=1 Tax=Durusdinium trenchii TaxID=1381693 RepID=A0ABP0Q2L5_9DINO